MGCSFVVNRGDVAVVVDELAGVCVVVVVVVAAHRAYVVVECD